MNATWPIESKPEGEVIQDKKTSLEEAALPEIKPYPRTEEGEPMRSLYSEPHQEDQPTATWVLPVLALLVSSLLIGRIFRSRRKRRLTFPRLRFNVK